MMKKGLYTFIKLILIIHSLVGYSQNLDIYRLTTYASNNGNEFGFVSLTDGFPFSEHPDSLVIANEHLGNLDLDVVDDNLHELDSANRKRFLSRLNIKESDKLFLYHLIKDTIYTLKVSDLALVAHLTPYEPQLPIPDYDYYIGLKIKENQLSMEEVFDYGNNFVAIGQSCPFQTGELEPIIWKKMVTENFPLFHKVKNLPSDLDGFQVQDIYEYNLGSLTYYMMNYANKNNAEIRHLIVVDSLTNQLVYNKLFLVEGDHDLTPLATSFSEDKSAYQYQWTGKLFKNKSSIIYNVVEPWFGCKRIYFVDEEELPIRISCDNRH